MSSSLPNTIAAATSPPRRISRNSHAQDEQDIESSQQTADDRKARVLFAAALVRLQPKLPIVEERGTIKDRKGDIQHTYALWEDINEAIRPILAKCGFALTFRTGLDGRNVSVTAVLSHKAGHREETTILLPIDLSGAKNSVQAIGSSTSYGKRYTTLALLNITCRGEDDDGITAVRDVELLSPVQLRTLEQSIASAKADRAKLVKYLKVSELSALPASKYDLAMRVLSMKGARQ